MALTAPEQLFWAEVRSDKSTYRSLAVCYALLIALEAGRMRAGIERDETFWPAVNTAVNDRLGINPSKDFRKIDRFRNMAWQINAAACEIGDAAS